MDKIVNYTECTFERNVGRDGMNSHNILGDFSKISQSIFFSSFAFISNFIADFRTINETPELFFATFGVFKGSVFFLFFLFFYKLLLELN